MSLPVPAPGGEVRGVLLGKCWDESWALVPVGELAAACRELLVFRFFEMSPIRKKNNLGNAAVKTGAQKLSNKVIVNFGSLLLFCLFGEDWL